MRDENEQTQDQGKREGDAGRMVSHSKVTDATGNDRRERERLWGDERPPSLETHIAGASVTCD